uniref:Uncharacterized protein n=1 Tax=Pan troglodytes TaxID=9598 RepID=G2HHJ9_PANTR|nr:hypothetical protein [Pan troglodytes]
MKWLSGGRAILRRLNMTKSIIISKVTRSGCIHDTQLSFQGSMKSNFSLG